MPRRPQLNQSLGGPKVLVIIVILLLKYYRVFPRTKLQPVDIISLLHSKNCDINYH